MRALKIIAPLSGFAAILLGSAGWASAHPIPFSYLDLRLQAAQVQGSLVVHIIDVAHDLGIAQPGDLLDPRFAEAERRRVGELLGERLSLALDGREVRPAWDAIAVLPDRQSVRLELTFPIDHSPGVVEVRCALFPYDPNHQTFLNVYEAERLVTQGILDRTRTSFVYYPGTRQGALAVAARFIPAGIHHIVVGPDHILFLIGLLLMGGTLRQLLLIVTAFTAAHSVTLTLAALSLLNPPASLVEPAIALSIVYVGADNLLIKGGRDVRPWVALVFGFVHGFGFASVLREIGLPGQALGWSLFSFNLGVEIGQVFIVAAAALVLAGVRSQSEALGRRLVVAGSLVVIGAGTYWFVQRVFFPGGMV